MAVSSWSNGRSDCLFRNLLGVTVGPTAGSETRGGTTGYYIHTVLLDIERLVSSKFAYLRHKSTGGCLARSGVVKESNKDGDGVQPQKEF